MAVLGIGYCTLPATTGATAQPPLRPPACQAGQVDDEPEAASSSCSANPAVRRRHPCQYSTCSRCPWALAHHRTNRHFLHSSTSRNCRPQVPASTPTPASAPEPAPAPVPVPAPVSALAGCTTAPAVTAAVFAWRLNTRIYTAWPRAGRRPGCFHHRRRPGFLSPV